MNVSMYTSIYHECYLISIHKHATAIIFLPHQNEILNHENEAKDTTWWMYTLDFLT